MDLDKHSRQIAIARKNMQQSLTDQRIRKFKTDLKHIDNIVMQTINKEQILERQKVYSGFATKKKSMEKKMKEQIQVIKSANLFSEAIYHRKVQ